ncbi:bifunctional metallophosphatase/5'-nucleotidase, partial [Desulfovibrio sp. OttesenSCG-928-F07]|nr:bifunctional metallophosphatase/5'-nucleotidase [Desulfovibrio sp. OttesenSCG-928-F07]
MNTVTRRSFLTFMLGLMACSGCSTVAPSSNKDKKLYILHINDVHGFIKPSESAIGYAKIGGFIEQFKALHPNTIVLDAGDAYAGSAHAALDKGAGVLQLQNTLELDAMTAGNADFTLGIKLLKERAAAANFTILSANMMGADGKPLLKTGIVLTTNAGLKVGVLGLTLPLSRTADYYSLDIVEAAKAEVARLRQQADVIVALTHLGDGKKDKETSLRIAREVPGINVIIDGHSHSILPEGRVENGVLIAQAGEYSKFVGLVELELDGAKTVAAKASLFDHAFFKDAPEKAKTAVVQEHVLAKNNLVLGTVVGATSVFLNGRRNELRVGETTAGNLMADAVREIGNAEIGLVITGQIGGEIKPGNITREDVMTLVRINGKLATVEAPGKSIVAALQKLTGVWPEPHGMFCQVSGISFTLDATNKDNKLSNIRVAGKPIQDNKIYTVCCTASIAQNSIKNGTNVRSAGTLEDALLAYLKKHSPVATKVENRIH